MSREALGSYQTTSPESSPPISDNNLIEFPGSAPDTGQSESPGNGQVESQDAPNKLELVEPRQQHAGDFFTPKTEEANSTNPENNLEPSENLEAVEEPLSETDQKILTQLGIGYENQDQLKTELSFYVENQVDDLAKYTGVAETLGLETFTEGFAEATTAQIEEARVVQEKFTQVTENLKKLEQSFLEIDDQMDIIKQQIEVVSEVKMKVPTPELLEANLKELRKKAVIDFIKDSCEWVKEDYDSYFQEARNGKKAEALAKTKIATNVWHAAQRFIENGGEPDYGFELSFHHVEHQNRDGENVRHITDIDVKTGLGWDSEHDRESEQDTANQTHGTARASSVRAA